MPTCRNKRQARQRRGLTLLEVILALTILGMSMVVIGQLVRIGAESAIRARDLTQAQFLAESKMEEIRAEIFPMESVGPIPFEAYENSDPTQQWVYTVLVEPLQDTGLMAVGVSVERTDAAKPVQFTLIAWVIDKELEDEVEEMEAELEAEAAAAEAAGSTQPSGGSGSSSGGGQGNG